MILTDITYHANIWARVGENPVIFQNRHRSDSDINIIRTNKTEIILKLFIPTVRPDTNRPTDCQSATQGLGTTALHYRFLCALFTTEPQLRPLHPHWATTTTRAVVSTHEWLLS